MASAWPGPNCDRHMGGREGEGVNQYMGEPFLLFSLPFKYTELVTLFKGKKKNHFLLLNASWPGTVPSVTCTLQISSEGKETQGQRT